MKAAERVFELTGISKFDFAVVGGSGVELGRALFEIPYSEIPQMPAPKVPGHKGVLKVYSLNGRNLLFFEGRFHYYEGRSDEEIRFIPELCHSLGVEVFIPTCASGAVSRKAASAEIGVIYDHINLLGRNPLVGLIGDFGSRVFVNGKEFYDKELVDEFLKKGLEIGINVTPVVLASMLGPNYETFSEVRMLEVLGADCVSMSTVPEVITAKFLEMRVVGLTVITNDTLKREANHEEVLKLSNERSKKLELLIRETLSSLNYH
jgi:purine-nucleoside phosphorylase